MALNDENYVKLEGTVYRTPEIVEVNDKKVMNFSVENVRHNARGEDRQVYNCVAWTKVVEKFGDKIVGGAFVRITGHLQANTLPIEEGKDFKYCKVCVDYIEID